MLDWLFELLRRDRLHRQHIRDGRQLRARQERERQRDI